jgi:carotenoid cleavage dioxygenase-like enzyme
MAIDPRTLATKGFKTMKPGLAGMPFLAHPRIEPNGRSWNIGQSGSKAVVWRNAPDGALEDWKMIELGPGQLHPRLHRDRASPGDRAAAADP